MKRSQMIWGLFVIGLTAAILSCATDTPTKTASATAPTDKDGFVQRFDVAESDLVSTGKNPFFVLEPGFVLVLEGKEEGKPFVLTITVLNETKKIGNVETRIVEEREVVNGKAGEVSRNYFAINKQNNDVYYFGEDAGGAWLSGKDGAHFGLMLPGTPKIGFRHYQEIAPKVAMDRAEIVGLDETVVTPAGKFEHCLKVEETTPLEKGKEIKYYAPGIGMIVEGDLKLTKFSHK